MATTSPTNNAKPGGARLQAEAKLKARTEDLERRVEERTDELLVAGVGTWDWDLVENAAICSAQYFRLYGLEPAESTVTTFEEWKSCIHPADRDRTADNALAARETDEPYEDEYRVVWPDGTIHWLAGKGRMLRDQTGKPARMLGVNIDMTERKQAEAEHRRLATIVVDSNDAVTVQDFEGRLMAWNRGAAQMYGYSETEALKMNIRDIVPKENRCDGALEYLEQIAGGGNVQSLVTRRSSKDGRTLDVWLTVTKLVDDDGKPVGVATTERDITERKKAEKVNARLSSLVNSTSDAVVALEMNGTITHWNTAAERLFGYSCEEAIGQNVQMLVSPDRSHEFQQFVERLQRGETVGDFETLRIHKDGQSKNVSLTKSLIQMPDGQVAGVSAILRDISERKRLEQQLADLTEKERRRIGHELHDTTGQELTGLAFIAQSVLEQLAAESHPAKETVRKIEEGIQRALAQVRRFAQGLVPVELDACGLMAALQKLARNTTEDRNIPCTFRGHQLVSIEDNAMATQMYLIAKEAVGNAVKHAQAEHVEIELSREDNRVTLLVRDDGVGIGEPSEEDGIGFQIMRYRAALIQATFEIKTVDKGTLVMCALTA